MLCCPEAVAPENESVVDVDMDMETGETFIISG